MVIDFKPAGEPGTRAEFGYHITPATISITGNGRQRSRNGFAQIEYWHQAPVITFSIMARHSRGAWHGVQWDGKTATSFPLNETDEKKAMHALVLKNPLEEAANASDRKINAVRKTVMSEHDKNLFIEQHNDGYAILRGGVEKPLAVEPTQDVRVGVATAGPRIEGEP
jgi:hypothetical protein